MSWFGVSKSSKNKHAQEKAKKRAIQSLMGYHGHQFSVYQVAAQKNSYRIAFKTTIGRSVSEMSLYVLLDEQFPDVAPRLYCESKYSHPNLDNNGNLIGVNGVSPWSAHNADNLGGIIASAVQKFVACPPTLKAQRASYVPVAAVASTKPPPPSYQEHQQLKKQASVLDMSTIQISVPKHIDNLDKLSPQEIDELVDNDGAIEQFAYDVASGLREMRQSQQSEVLRIARNNVSKKEELSTTDEEIQKLREEIATLTSLYSDLQQRHEKQLQKFSKQRLNQELEKEIAASESKTKALREQFDEADIAPVPFIKKYVKERTNYHLLHIKKEKMNIV
mmetsp:Transcript_41340/g.68009  ORF Transcript_41340/g.68009 Transcript_41340/m.68009 type:complete len:334 (+) Transcript_41340:1443-2444(+)